MADFTQKESELEPLFTSKVWFVVFGATLKTKSGFLGKLFNFEVTLITLRFAEVIFHKTYSLWYW